MVRRRMTNVAECGSAVGWLDVAATEADVGLDESVALLMHVLGTRWLDRAVNYAQGSSACGKSCDVECLLLNCRDRLHAGSQTAGVGVVTASDTKEFADVCDAGLSRVALSRSQMEMETECPSRVVWQNYRLAPKRQSCRSRIAIRKLQNAGNQELQFPYSNETLSLFHSDGECAVLAVGTTWMVS